MLKPVGRADWERAYNWICTEGRKRNTPYHINGTYYSLEQVKDLLACYERHVLELHKKD